MDINKLLSYTTYEQPTMSDNALVLAIHEEVIDRDLPVTDEAMFHLNRALGVYAE